MIAFTTAINTQAINSTVFYEMIQGRFFEDEAPQEMALPYVVYSIISEVPDKTFTEDYEQYRVQFSIFSEKSSSLEAKTIMKALKDAFDDENILTTEGVIISCSRISASINSIDIETADGSGKEWQADIDYQMTYLRDSD